MKKISITRVKNMSTRKKFILICLTGFVIGIICGFLWGIDYGYDKGYDKGYGEVDDRIGSSYDSGYNAGYEAGRTWEGLKLFDKPKQEMKVDSFIVFEVLSNGNALARHECGHNEYGGRPDDIALFKATDDSAYYDNQKIELPQGKHFRVIGTYRYKYKNDDDIKTVPVLGIYDK